MDWKAKSDRYDHMLYNRCGKSGVVAQLWG